MWDLLQINQLYQALATQEVLANRINSFLVLVFSWDLLTVV